MQEELNLLDDFIGEGHGPIVIVEAINTDDAVLGPETDGQLMDGAFAPTAVHRRGKRPPISSRHTADSCNRRKRAPKFAHLGWVG